MSTSKSGRETEKRTSWRSTNAYKLFLCPASLYSGKAIPCNPLRKYIAPGFGSILFSEYFKTHRKICTPKVPKARGKSVTQWVFCVVRGRCLGTARDALQTPTTPAAEEETSPAFLPPPPSSLLPLPSFLRPPPYSLASRFHGYTH